MGFKNCFYKVAFKLCCIYFYFFDREWLREGNVSLLGNFSLLLDDFKV
jgi:hypothetical protein